jgi:hypothetical protein
MQDLIFSLLAVHAKAKNQTMRKWRDIDIKQRNCQVKDKK